MHLLHAIMKHGTALGLLKKCNNLANRLPQILDSIHELEQLPVTKQESSPIANRLRSLSELNERTAGVDPQRVEEAQTEILASYLQATIPMYIARSAEEDNPNFQEFLLLGFLERAKLEDFNSSSHWWGPYVSDIGRALAAREQHYLQEAIGQQIRAVNTTISRADPKFRVLTEHVTDLVKRGLTPDVLLAPIELFVPFVKYYEAELNWSHRPERLKIGNVELRVHWSHRYAPSTCFTLFDHNAGTWRIYPDQATGTATTIALGQSKLYPNMFEIGVVTTVKYDVTEPDAFCRICVSDQSARRIYAHSRSSKLKDS